jgi:hypothetical protein
MFPGCTGDPLKVKIRKLAADCKVDTELVTETVNQIFDLDLQYDKYNALKNELAPKVSLHHW